MQDPNDVDTKAGKQINTWFFPVGKTIIDEVTDYLSYMKTELGFTDEDPLFSSTARGQDENDRFIASGLTKKRCDALARRHKPRDLAGESKEPFADHK